MSRTLTEHGDTFVTGREQCSRCAENGNDNSCDNMARYSDGHGYCYACKYYEKGEGQTMSKRPQPKDWTAVYGEYRDLPSRRLEEKTLRKYGYQIKDVSAGEMHINTYYSNGVPIAQKYRLDDTKEFRWRGDSRAAKLFGQDLFEGGKKITITEGEIDAMTVYQVNGGYPAVSLNGGVNSVTQNIKNSYEWLCTFDEIIIMFDSDDAGRAAAVEAAEILPPGRCKIAILPWKDANECLVNNNSKAIIDGTFQAKLHSPDEILHVSDIDSGDDEMGEVWDLPWDNLTDYTIGQRAGELTMFISGTGSGKSTIVREIAWHHLTEGRSVGMIMLEEAPKETRDDLVSLMISLPVREIRAGIKLNKLREKQGKEPRKLPGEMSDEVYTGAVNTLNEMPLYIFNHFGNNAYANALARIEYMAVCLNVNVIILDHITALTAGLMGVKDTKELDERQMMDQVMKDLRSITTRTGVHIDVVSQLKKTMKSYEEGSAISVEDIRGSNSLGSVPNSIIALERNRQDPDHFSSNCTAVRILKNRLNGKCGIATGLWYNHHTGRVEEVNIKVSEIDGQMKNIFRKKGK